MLTCEMVRELFQYDAETGILRRTKKISTRSKNPDEVGCLHRQGYLVVTINRKQYQVHRIVWILVHGCWPVNDIDHINGVKNDNRIANLRDVTPKTNRENLRTANVDNKTGYLGVSYNAKRRKYKSQIRANDKYLTLGYFETAVIAHAAYVEAKRKYHKGNTL